MDDNAVFRQPSPAPLDKTAFHCTTGGPQRQGGVTVHVSGNAVLLFPTSGWQRCARNLPRSKIFEFLVVLNIAVNLLGDAEIGIVSDNVFCYGLTKLFPF
jgi:hypothetical protein